MTDTAPGRLTAEAGHIPVYEGSVDRSLTQTTRSLARIESIPSTFRTAVHELAGRLAVIADDVSDLELSLDAVQSPDRVATENAAIHAFGQLIHEDIRSTNLALSQAIGREDPAALKRALDYFRRWAGPFVYQSPFAARSFRKPLGYAGDYEMMRMIYRNADEGATLFGRCMERAMQMHPEPQAVRNRVAYLGDRIVAAASSADRRVRILSLACGPGREIEVAIASGRLPPGCALSVHLVDQDERALEHARKVIAAAADRTGIEVDIYAYPRNVIDVVRRGLDVQDLQLVYSSGLFDYLSDGVVVRAGRALSSIVAPGGFLVIGNFNASIPNAFGMLTMFDWPLILRSREELSALLDRPGFSCRIDAEPEGINLFHVAQRV